MITSRRSTQFDSQFGTRNGGVDLLERKNPENYNEFIGNTKEEESMEMAKERIQRNLDRLLHYDRYTAEKMDEVVTENKEELVDKALTFSDEDIRPSSTTMQFGDDNVNEVLNDLQRSKEESKVEYHLNAKGKVVVFLYALAVSVILALIILNTGVLSVLYKNKQTNSAELQTKMNAYSKISSEISNVSSDENVLKIAETDFGMISLS